MTPAWSLRSVRLAPGDSPRRKATGNISAERVSTEVPSAQQALLFKASVVGRTGNERVTPCVSSPTGPCRAMFTRTLSLVTGAGFATCVQGHPPPITRVAYIVAYRRGWRPPIHLKGVASALPSKAMPKNNSKPTSALVGSGKIVNSTRRHSDVASKKEPDSGVIEKGGKQPSNAPQAKPATSNQIPKPPQGSGDKNKNS